MSQDNFLDNQPASQRPTKVRYIVVGLATLMAVLLYLDRFSLGYLITFVEEEFALSEFQRGVLLSAFFWTYALGQVPAGWLSDRYGARIMLTLYIILWSVFTGVLGLAMSFAVLLLLRFLFGLAQAGAYPTGASIISKWVPFSARGTASSIVSVGGRLGGAIQPVLTAYLLIAFVPMSVPAGFSEEDQRDPAGFLKRLSEETGTETATPEKEQADKMAAMVRSRLEVPPQEILQLPEEQQRHYLTEALNDLLSEKNLYQEFDLSAIKLPDEAHNLARIPADQVTEAQVVRRNRFLAEAIFPEYLRKLYVQGWRPVAIVYGVAGLLVALLFWLGVRNRPEEHPACNEAEIQLIESGRPKVTRPYGRVQAIPFEYIVQSRSLWLSSISQFGTNFGWLFLVVMLPTYLKEEHQVPPILRGWMSSAPIFIGMAGMLCGGMLTDWLTRRLGLRWGRALPMALTRFLAMAAFLACLAGDAPWVFVAAFCVVAVATDLGTASVWAYKQDVGGRYVGSILGWGNMWGNFGAAVSPIALNLIGGYYKWELRFLACAIAFAISGIAALGVDARIPVVPDDED